MNLTIGAGGAIVSGGQINLSGTASGIVGTLSGPVGSQVDSTLDNSSTIVGSGNIGGDLIVENAGTIKANGANPLAIDTGATVTNTGVISSKGAGGLILGGQDSVQTIANSGAIKIRGAGGLTLINSFLEDSSVGTITAPDGAPIVLESASISGPSLTNVSGGSITVNDPNGFSDLDVGAFSNNGALNIGPGSMLLLQGGIVNSGAISLQGTQAAGAQLQIGNDMTLSGGGSIVLGDSGADSIYGSEGGAAPTLTNVDNTISGSGDLGEFRQFEFPLTLVNQTHGVIDANGDAPLTIICAGESLNAGLIEATGAGGLVLASSMSNSGLISVTGAGGLTIDATIDDTSGGVISIPTGSPLILNRATIVGGSLTNTPVGLITVDNQFGGSTLATSTLTNQGAIDLPFGSQLTLEGSVDNTGTISLPALDAKLLVSGTVTLTGPGSIILADASLSNEILGVTASDTLVNDGNTIAGSGDLGGGQMVLVNQAGGTIDADGANVLDIDTGANKIVNDGKIESTAAGGETIASAIENDGVLSAKGGNLTVNGAVTGSGFAKISGATLSLAVSFSQNVTFTGNGGVLDLAQSQGYAGTIAGFSTSGGTTLDLGDIGFASGTTTAAYSGSSTGGTLTVTDGTHTSHIALLGDFTHSTFTVSGDGHGGTAVIDPAVGPHAAFADRSALQSFATAMAGLGAKSAAASSLSELSRRSLDELALRAFLSRR